MPEFHYDSPNAADETDKFIEGLKATVPDVGDFRRFALAYIEAMFFAPSDDEITAEHELSLGAITQVLCETWAAWCLMRDSINMDAYDGVYDPVEVAGHDLWFTRNGHGSGFWDGDWREPYATKLTDISETMGESSLYLGDDGFVHIL